MFKSKGFTAGFIALSVLILALLGILIYLIVGRAGLRLQNLNNKKPAVETSETPSEELADMESDTEAETPEETEEEIVIVAQDTSIRALTSLEEHVYPLHSEVLPEQGVLTIIKAGDQGEGIVFHADAAFDDAALEGNELRTEGTFEVTGKVYVIDNGKPYLMYQISEGLFVTANGEYISFSPTGERKVTPNPARISSYGFDEDLGLALTIYHEDGNTAVFSVFSLNPESRQTEEVLSNVVGEYNASGILEFEFHNADDQVYDGEIVFSESEGTEHNMNATIHFGSQVTVGENAYLELTLHN